jgi:flagellar protein FliO/FliZ
MNFVSVFLRAVPLVLAFAAMPVAAQTQEAAPAAPSFSAELMSLVLPLLVIMIIATVALWLLKRRFSVSTANGPLRIRSILAVGPRERIVLIEAENQSLVVGVTPNRISTLASWPREESASDDRTTNDHTDATKR